MSTTDLSYQQAQQQRAQQQRQEAYRASQRRAADRQMQLQRDVMAKSLARSVNERGTRQGRLIQAQLNPSQAPNALTQEQRLAARQAIYGADLRARSLAAQPGNRPLGDLQIRAGQAQTLNQEINSMDKLAANIGIAGFAAQAAERIEETRERTTEAVKESATELAQRDVMQAQVAKAFALMNAGDGLAAFSFRSAEAEAAELAELADRVPMDLVEKATASAGLASSPARNAIIQRAIAAEALARHAQAAQKNQAVSQEQSTSSAGEVALATATFGLLAVESRDEAVDELVKDGADGIGKAIGLAAVAPVLILEQSLEVMINK